LSFFDNLTLFVKNNAVGQSQDFQRYLTANVLKPAARRPGVNNNSRPADWGLKTTSPAGEISLRPGAVGFARLQARASAMPGF
jgi:hypothetical protein